MLVEINWSLYAVKQIKTMAFTKRMCSFNDWESGYFTKTISNILRETLWCQGQSKGLCRL